MLGWILGFALCCGLSSPGEAPVQYHHLQVAVYASSWYSTGSAHIEKVAQAAAAKGFDALILTDADRLQAEYGLPFLRNIFASALSNRLCCLKMRWAIISRKCSE